MKKTLVLGASENPARYSFEAVTRLRKHGHEVVAVGRKSAVVAGVQIETEPPTVNDIDTVTLYLNPTAQKAYYDFILSLHPKRIIFNPGTENEELEELAQQNGIAAIEACTLVMLNTGQY
jgi:predicted CoA-binding protein